MEIRVQTQYHGPENRFRLKSFDTSSPPKPCCDRMADEWGGIIDLSLQGFPKFDNISAVFCTASFPLPNGDLIHTVTPINRCPWCGDPVVISEEPSSFPETRIRLSVAPEPAPNS